MRIEKRQKEGANVKLNRIYTMFLSVLLMFCLCTPAMAETIQLTGGSLVGGSYDVNSGDIITGSGFSYMQIITVSGTGDVELTLRDVNGSGSLIIKPGANVTSLTLKLEGENKVDAFATLMPLTIMGSGSLECETSSGAAVCVSGNMTVNGGSIAARGDLSGIALEKGTLTINAGTVAAETTGADDRGAIASVPSLAHGFALYKPYNETIVLGEGDYSIEAGASTDDAQTVSGYNGERYLHIVYSEPMEPVIPETGDAANLIHWFALLAMSVIGMMLLRRRKEA